MLFVYYASGRFMVHFRVNHRASGDTNYFEAVCERSC